MTAIADRYFTALIERLEEVRDTQDAALDTLFLRCRELIGERHGEWRNTRSDFSFSSGMETPSSPA